MRLFLLFYLLFVANYDSTLGSSFIKSVGARSLAMGTTSVAMNNAFAVVNNPAIIPLYFDNSQIIVGIDYLNLHQVSDLSVQTGFVSFVRNWGVSSLVFQKYGFSEYEEKKIGLSFSRSFGKHLAICFQFDYLDFSLAHHDGIEDIFTYEIGLVYKVFEKLNIGFHIFNPTTTTIKTEFKTISILPNIRLGACYLLERNLNFSVELESTAGDDTLIKMGLEYRFKQTIALRAGMFSNPLHYTMGCGLNWNKFQVDLGVSHHPVLGFSSGASMIYFFTNNRNKS